jgi:diguanylate cyclase (GGDEF)-like protein
MSRQRTWLCPSPLDRSRLLDMERRMRPTRNAGLLLTALVAVAAIPVFGPFALAVIAVVAVTFVPFDYALPRVERPELVVLASALIPIVALATLVALRGGAENPAMPLVVIPVIGAAAILPARGSVLVLAVATFAISAAAIGANYAAFIDDPRLTMCTLTALVVGGLMARGLMLSEIDHRSRAVVDPLTGLLNRASLPERFAELREQALRTDGRLAVVLCDLDRFKQVNDTYGHQTGDVVLQTTAYEMRRALRSFELMYRLGGEEFLVLLPDADLADATEVAESMRTAAAARPAADVPVSVSFGVTAARGGDIDLDRMLEAADRALFSAKREGRDRVVADDRVRASRAGVSPAAETAYRRNGPTADPSSACAGASPRALMP